MQLVRFSTRDRETMPGSIEEEGLLLDLATASSCDSFAVPEEQKEILQRSGSDLVYWLSGERGIELLNGAREHALDHLNGSCRTSLDFEISHALEDCALERLILNARKLLGVGINFPSHLAEARANGDHFDDPTEPLMFSKVGTAISGDNENVRRPEQGIDMDYEVELGVVIGKECRDLTRDTVLDAVAGYVVVNDMSLRDMLGKPGGVFEGKNYDGFLPMSSALVTRDEVSDVPSLVLESFVNGEMRQRERMGNAVFSPEDIIIHVSERMTLEPGDVIFCGTPAGVGLYATDPREALLKPGDTVEARIEKIGSVTTRVI